MMERICAGIVLCNPDPERLAQSLASLRGQAERVYLCDNGSANIAEIRKLAGDPAATLLENGENLGIAAALNRLCREAADAGYTWIMTLDHDTVLPEDAIPKMAPYLGDAEAGILCPAVWYEGWKEQPQAKDGTERVSACMTSGSLTRLAAWEKAGGFREAFFIDFVDNDFCMQLRLNGYAVVRVNSVVMRHSLGEVRTVRIPLLGERRWVTHKPWRVYYMIRNNLVFVKDYKAHLNVPKEKAKVAYIAWISWLHTKEKKETLRAIRQGMKDAKSGKLGKCEVGL